MLLFTAKASNLIAIGPILDLQVVPSRAASAAMKSAGQTPPEPVTVSAMIDTGASNCVIQNGIAQNLNLQPVGSHLINTPTSQNVQCFQYAVGLVFPATAGLNLSITMEMVVTEAPLVGQHIQCLLGRDFLAHGIPVYSGPEESFIFGL